MDNPIRRRCWKNYETRIPTREYRRSLSWQSHPSNGRFVVGIRLQIAFLFPKLTEEQQKMMMEQRLKQMEQEPQKK